MIELGVSDIVSNHQQIRLESAVTCAESLRSKP